MQIIRNRAIVDDAWQHESSSGDLPEGDIIVTLGRWQSDREQLLKRQSRLGVCLASEHDVDAIAPDLGHFDLIALTFPVFVDGRGFSQARWLRERHGYGGEIRAVGEVLRDQLAFMERCGFNAFELRADQDLHDAVAAFDEIEVVYQPTADGQPSVVERRRALPAHSFSATPPFRTMGTS